ncbi:Dihydroflavonol-4-reductase [Capsicum chinense]|nr:Dihydroflavonol-4-reductase [Capsicum chinense]
MEEKLKSYCVTGGTGYIGSWLIKSLLQMGYKVHAAVRHPAQADEKIFMINSTTTKIEGTCKIA